MYYIYTGLPAARVDGDRTKKNISFSDGLVGTSQKRNEKGDKQFREGRQR